VDQNTEPFKSQGKYQYTIRPTTPIYWHNWCWPMKKQSIAWCHSNGSKCFKPKTRISLECKILTVTEKVCQVNPYQPEYEANWQSTHSSRSNSLWWWGNWNHLHLNNWSSPLHSWNN
jgi:hypothetical protein